MTKHITRRQAEETLQIILQQFRPYVADDSKPVLYEPGHHSDSWSIGWDDGPYEWTYRAFVGGFDEEIYFLALDAGTTKEAAENMAKMPAVNPPKGVFPEPINGWCLGLYPDD